MNLNKSITPNKKLVKLFILVVLFALVYKIWDSDLVYAYRKYFFADDVIHINFNELGAITQQETIDKYKINWWCGSVSNDFGDSFCADELKGWNKAPAMLVVFWYKNKKLNHAKIDAPIWYFDKFFQQIKKEYGEPIRKSDSINPLEIMDKLGLLILSKDKFGKKNTANKVNNMAIWQLKSGGLLITQLSPGPNPLSWNTLLWVSPEQAKSVSYYH